MTQMHQSKVFSIGQTMIPKAFREVLGLKTGDTLRYFITEGQVQVLKVPSVTELACILVHENHLPVSLEDMDDAIAQGIIKSTK